MQGHMLEEVRSTSCRGRSSVDSVLVCSTNLFVQTVEIPGSRHRGLGCG